MTGWFKNACLVAGLVVGSWAYGDAAPAQPAPSPTPASAQSPASQSQTIDLRFVETTQSNCTWGYGLQNAKLELPFPNAAGKLTFQVQDGKVRADTNGDGTIDQNDASAVEAKNVIVKVAAQIGGQTVQYPFFIERADNQFLSISPRGALEGRFGQKTIRLCTGCSGRHLDQMIQEVVITSQGEGQQHVTWSPTICIGQQLYRVEMLGEGRQLKLTAYTGEVAHVKVKVNGLSDQAMAWCYLEHTQGIQTNAASSGSIAQFIPGPYRLSSVSLNLNTPKSFCYLSGSQPRDAKPLELKAGDNVLTVGAPFKLDFVAVRDGDKVELTDVTLLGCGGERYRPGTDPERGEIFAAYIRSGDKEQQLAKLEYG